MASSDQPTSLYPFIEKTARLLRQRAKEVEKQKRKYSKTSSLSNKNKIEQIAVVLRSQAQKKQGKEN